MRSLTSPVATERQELGSAEVHGVRQALEDVLGSRPFRSTQQCSALLRYIVEHTLVGADGLLRERVIGAEVFGRPPGYETNEDPVVRLRAAEVRKRLAQFYSASPEPFDVRIEIPSGSYRAVFHFRSADSSHLPSSHEHASVLEAPLVQAFPAEAAPGAGEVSAVVQSETTKLPRRNSRLIPMLVAAALLLVVLGAVLAGSSTPEKTSFRKFWAPWTRSNTPVILAIGSNAVYRLRPDYVTRYAQEHGLAAQGLEIYVPFGKDNPVSGSDLVPAYNSFVMWGDVAAISGISAHLAKQNQSFQDRFPNDISFAEIRNTPSILVGGFNNPMTIALTKHLRFIMRDGDEIVDTERPNQKWTLQALDTADLAILTRLVQKDGDAPLLSTAGLGQYGTLAAAQLVCDPAALYRISRQLPKDWTSKNLQAVLRVSIVNFKPTITDIVAYKSW